MGAGAAASQVNQMHLHPSFSGNAYNALRTKKVISFNQMKNIMHPSCETP